MPASLKYPGEVGGHCESLCPHFDCIAARQIALEHCRICKQQIGYNQPFYSEVEARVHKHCLEVELAKKLKTEAELRFLIVEEAASLLRVEIGTVRNWVSQNKIPYRKAGANILFMLEEILEWTLPPTRKQKASGLKAVE
jgi:excisionase family DNA binding protein